MATAPGYTVPQAVIEAFITKAAQERGIDPNIALEVYRREGATNWQSTYTKNGVREPSFGPYQLYTGGGLGNTFQQATGLDPADPNTWQQNITFALDQAKKGGWGPWYGAKAAGITGFMGIDGNAPSAPLSLSPPTQTADAPAANPVALAAAAQQPTSSTGNLGQLAQLFGALGGSPSVEPTPSPLAALAAAKRPPPQLPPVPSYELAALGRHFYSRG